MCGQKMALFHWTCKGQSQRSLSLDLQGTIPEAFIVVVVVVVVVVMVVPTCTNRADALHNHH